MKDYLLLMHDDAVEPVSATLWPAYFDRLRAAGAFQGGSVIGPGGVFRKAGAPGRTSEHLTGHIRIEAESLPAAEALIASNPVFECGGSVEIRELPRD